MVQKTDTNVMLFVLHDDAKDDCVKAAFIRNEPAETFGGLLDAMTRAVLPNDGHTVDGTMHDCVEGACCDLAFNRAGLNLAPEDLMYLTSIRAPGKNVSICMYKFMDIDEPTGTILEWYSKAQIMEREDFAPDVKELALLLFERESIL